METDSSPSDLQTPLLAEGEQQDANPDVEATTGEGDLTEALVPAAGSTDETDPATQAFSVASEISEMIHLGLPLAISFFCRMGMASTDSAFVGHITNGTHTAGTYLAASTLSDMIINILVVPPLAFNQVLNALVGQAIGSNNPKMAGIWLQQSMFWLSLTMLPCFVGFFYVEPILRFLDFDEDVAKVAAVYTKYNIVWPIPNGLYQCMRFYFQAQGLPRPAMYNNIFFLFVNAGLNYLFVFGGPFRNWGGFGFVGAAISLSISRTMQGFVYFLYMFVYKKHHVRTWPGLSWANHTRARTMEFMKQTVPNIGTLLFQSCASQATTILIGRLGERALASSSALATVFLPWSGTMGATTGMVSAIRVGYHLGRGDAKAAKSATWIVIYFIAGVTGAFALIFLPLRQAILRIATNDTGVSTLAATLIPPMLISTFLNLIVGNITSGVFSGMGRPLIATILSFGLELPLSIGGVAVYILYFHGGLLGVYWLQAIFGLVEFVIVFLILQCSNWEKCAQEARERQESPAQPQTEEQVEGETAECPADEEAVEHQDSAGEGA